MTPTPLDVLRWNQRYYRTWHLMEAETSLLRAWRLWRAWMMSERPHDGAAAEEDDDPAVLAAPAR